METENYVKLCHLELTKHSDNSYFYHELLPSHFASVSYKENQLD